MGRKKRQHPMERVAQTYMNQHAPELRDARLYIRTLDGPPDAPRYVVTAERCTADCCPYGVATSARDSGQCPVVDCPLRQGVRLLMNRRGDVVHVTESTLRWQ